MTWIISKALLKDYENSRCSRERAEGYSEESCSDGDPSAQLNVMPTQHQFSRNDKTMDILSRSPFGLTYARLTESRGEAVLTWFREVFRARTSVLPEEAQESEVGDPACGWKWHESSVKYDLDSRSWKTRQCSLLGGLVEFLETWPRWGSMRSGECWERPMWGRRTDEIEYGLWPTPCSQMPQRKTTDGQNISKSSGQKYGLSLIQAVKLYPTPQASDNRDRGGPSMPCVKRRQEIGKQVALSQTIDGPLNPEWVEWLMGWPIGWTDLKPLAMDKFREWLRLHSANYTGE